ncbi:hypothetical protein HD554DRAFT_256447 [Boletus coccyginus]|nr:hypothetical protein HD554DRAFT_256447 [Boletus coccyginus]
MYQCMLGTNVVSHSSCVFACVVVATAALAMRVFIGKSSNSTLSANLRTESKESSSSGQVTTSLIIGYCSISAAKESTIVQISRSPRTLLCPLALCLVAGGKEKPLGFEFCGKENSGFETVAYICASDYRLVADAQRLEWGLSSTVRGERNGCRTSWRCKESERHTKNNKSHSKYCN